MTTLNKEGLDHRADGEARGNNQCLGLKVKASGKAKEKTPQAWRDVLLVHPAAEMFPLMSEVELRELADDIKKYGLRERITLYGDEKGRVVLDGRNRLDALALIGQLDLAEYDLHVFEFIAPENDFDPYAYVLSKNVHRRHLTSEQKRDLIAKVLKAKPKSSNLQIAKQVKADDKTVAKVRTELKSTSEIPKLKKTIGKDGKERPARKPKTTSPKFEQKTFDSPQAAHAPAKPPVGKKEYGELNSSWIEVFAQIRAGNLARLRDALEIHREKVTRILERL